MTRRITVSLPDDVAEYLDKHPNSSAIVTEAVRARMERAATTRALQEAAGFRFTPEGQAWARSVLRPLTNEEKAESQRYFEALEAGHLPKAR
jgi:Arc/MetJ-type ribon-helix-helix transcriptional regulator